ncbi:serine protease [Terasakiella sp. SH-1]|uniref:serine protease n=1 Tax=Terasakiella sp. SH-1 TaxID=2560057 RepID=UPI001074106F|nr:serine protease [Terasakiella sp. SH-1]
MTRSFKTKIYFALSLWTFACLSASPATANDTERFKLFLQTDQPEQVITQADPNDREENLLLGEAYLQTGQIHKALEVFEAAQFQVLDNDEAVYLGLAKTKLALGKFDHARRHLKMLRHSVSHKVDAELVLAAIEEMSAHAPQARNRLEKLHRQYPNHEAVVLAYASFNVKQQALNEASRVLEHFLQTTPTSAQAAKMLANIYQQWGLSDKAQTYFKMAAHLYKQAGNHLLAEQFAALSPTRHVQAQPVKQTQQLPPIKAAPVQKVVRKNLASPVPLPFKRGTALKTGSGFIIGQGQYIVTNRHVIDHLSSPNDKIAVRNGLGELHMATIYKVSTKDDLAILKTDQPFQADYAVSLNHLARATPGSEAIVMGFPLMDLLGQNTPSLTDGIVSKDSGLGDDQRTFLISSKMNKGNSGGPIFNKQGALIGIAVAKLDVMGVYEERGHLAEDMNLAIKANSLRDLIASKPTPTTALPQNMSLEDLYQRMLPSVVLIASKGVS